MTKIMMRTNHCKYDIEVCYLHKVYQLAMTHSMVLYSKCVCSQHGGEFGYLPAVYKLDVIGNNQRVAKHTLYGTHKTYNIGRD